MERAEAASRGREVRIIEEAMVRGRSGSVCAESGMASWGSMEAIFAVWEVLGLGCGCEGKLCDEV